MHTLLIVIKLPGQVSTQVLLYRDNGWLQDVQLLTILEQVAHEVLQLRQVLLMRMVTLSGHEVKHWVPYEKYPVTQDKHDVLVVQVEQGDTQLTHTTGICVVSAYM